MAEKWIEDAATAIRLSGIFTEVVESCLRELTDNEAEAVRGRCQEKLVNLIAEAHAECEAMKRLKSLLFSINKLREWRQELWGGLNKDTREKLDDFRREESAACKLVGQEEKDGD